MDWVLWLLLENFPALAVVLFVANFVLLVHWRRSGRPRPLLIGLAVAAVLVAVQTLVVTRREHALHLMTRIEKDILESRTGAFRTALAPDFAAGDMDRGQFIAMVGRLYGEVRVRSLNRSELKIEQSQAERFVAALAYQAEVDTDSFSSWVRTRWEITFVQTEEGWRIAVIKARHIDGIPNPDWSRIDRP